MKNARKQTPAGKASPVPTLAQAPLIKYLESVGIDPTKADIILFGDGSGSAWEQPCGWACVSIERVCQGADMLRRVWYGGVNCGTINTAEGLAYFQPLNFFHAEEIERRKREGARHKILKVHILTDSQYCRDMGNGPNPIHGKNGMIWAAYEALKRSGFLLTWHWVRREESELNHYVDLLSKLSRGLFVQNKLRSRLENTEQLDVSQCNP